jgi:RNA polymerase sigma-70 factor (ECF subfamily)
MSGERASSGDADERLVTRALSGDRGAFDALFLKYQDYVYNIVYGIVGKADAARDVTQDVFLQVYRSLGTFRRGSRFATWLYRVAANRAVDFSRAERRWRWTGLNEEARAKPDPSQGPEETAVRHGEEATVRAVLRMVPPKHRDVLVLRYFQNMSVEEIAEVLGVTVAAAKVRLHRARLHFKERFVATQGNRSAAPEPLR